MATAQNRHPIQTIDQVSTAHAEAVASNLQQAGHSATAQTVMPITAQTPIVKTPELGEVGAEVIGEDLSHIVSTTFGDLTEGKSKIRMTKSSRFLGKLLEKLHRKKKPTEEVVVSGDSTNK